MIPPAARLCALGGVLLWTPGDAFEYFGATNRTPNASYTCPVPSWETVEPSSRFYIWALILSCVMLLSAALLSTGICVLSYYFVRLDINFVTERDWIPVEEIEPPAQSLETMELLESPPSPDVEPQQGEIQAPPPSPIVQVHRAQEDSSEDETALVQRNIARRPLQPDSDKGDQ